MKDKNKKQGRKFNRAKWNWDDLDKIKPSNDEIVQRFEAWLEGQEAKELDQETEQGRSRARRKSAEQTLALAFVLGSGLLAGWWLMTLIVNIVS